MLWVVRDLQKPFVWGEYSCQQLFFRVLRGLFPFPLLIDQTSHRQAVAAYALWYKGPASVPQNHSREIAINQIGKTWWYAIAILSTYTQKKHWKKLRGVQIKQQHQGWRKRTDEFPWPSHQRWCLTHRGFTYLLLRGPHPWRYVFADIGSSHATRLYFSASVFLTNTRQQEPPKQRHSSEGKFSFRHAHFFGGNFVSHNEKLE